MLQRLLGHYVGVDGRRAFDGQFLAPNAFEGGCARVSDPDGRAYLIDRSGKPMFAARYDTIDSFHHGIANTRLGDRHGAVASDGRIVLEPSLERALFLPAEGRITFERGGKSGFLDVDGNVVVEPKWSAVAWLSDGLAHFFAEGGQLGYVDKDGNVVIEAKFDEANAFSNGRASVRVGDVWGVIGRDGKFVHQPKYSQIGQLVNGVCWAVDGERVVVLGLDGTHLGKRGFDEVKQAGESGVWPVRVDDKWGFLFPDGRLGKIDLENAWIFTEKLAPVQMKGKQGFMREDGTLAVPCRYDDVWGFANDRAAVQRDGGWTFVDAMGTEYGAPDLVEPARFWNGVASARTKSGIVLVRHDGSRVELPGVAWAGSFVDGVVPVIAPDRAGVRAPSPPHVRPVGGLSHPVYEEMDASAHLITIVSFARELTAAERVLLDKRIASWERCLRPDGDLYTENKFVSGWSVYMRVENLADPRADMLLLLDQRSDLPLQETLFARWGTPPDTEVMSPRNDPAMREVQVQVVFDTWDEYWESVWDPTLPRPVPENYFYLKGALFDENNDIACLEERHMPIFYPDVDVCLGALNTQCDYEPADARANEIHAACEAALAKQFGLAGLDAPPMRIRDGSIGIERVTYEGRSGYSFAFSCRDLQHRFSYARVRWREPEVMDALREVVKSHGLAPVILWQRYANNIPMTPLGVPTVMVVNLFEPGVVATAKPAKKGAAKSSSKKPAAKSSKKPAAKSSKKPAAKKPAAKSSSKKPATKKPAAKKPAAKKPATKKPAAKTASKSKSKSKR